MISFTSGFPPPLCVPKFLSTNMEPNSPAPALYITGLGSKYPPYLLGAEDLDKLASPFHDVSRPG